MQKKLTQEAFSELKNLLGEEYVENDPGVTQAYSKQPWPEALLVMQRPDAIVLPGSTEDVQGIYKLANKYNFSVIPAGNYNWDVPHARGTVIIDSKRMNQIIKIDEQAQFAIVEPGVTATQLQAEAMKKGLICNGSFAGPNSTILANSIFFGAGGGNYRLGCGRSVLAMDWVTPRGELIRTGSLTSPGENYFWPEGPGPDLRGLLRAFFGVMGGMGMVTRMGVKLLPWVGPRQPEPIGLLPSKRFFLPKDLFRFHLLRYPTLEMLGNAIYEIGKAEISWMVQRLPAIFWPMLATISKEAFWQEWNSGYYHKEAKNIIILWNVGCASSEQLEYEEEVLRQIVEETGGEDLPVEHKLYQMFPAEEWFRVSKSGRIMRPGGSHNITMCGFDSVDKAIMTARRAGEVRKQFKEFFLDDGDCDWICTYDFAWEADSECIILPEVDKENAAKSMEVTQAGIVAALQDKLYTVVQVAETAPVLGPIYGNYHELLKKIKMAYDPNNVANPPNPINIAAKE